MNKLLKGAGFYLLIFIIIVGIVQFSGNPTEQVDKLEFSKVYQELTDGNISSIHFISDTAVEGVIKNTKKKFTSYIPKEVMGNKFADEVL